MHGARADTVAPTGGETHDERRTRQRDVSRSRHRHFLRQGAADRRRSARRRRGLAPRSALSRPHPLWSEQNPDDWVEGVEAAVARDPPPRAATRSAGLAGIGLSGQMHGATFLDARNRVLRPAILWNDGRSFAECAELERRVPDFRRRAGNLAMPGFTAPKAVWVAAHEPDVFKATARVLLPKDFVRLRLTGEAVSEMSDASGTLWLDIAGAALGRRPRRRDRPEARRTCRAWSRAPRSRRCSRPRSPAAWGLARPANPDRGRRRATTPPRRSASARSGPARASSRSAPRASCSPSPTTTSACPSARCTRSATRCRGAGTACR